MARPEKVAAVEEITARFEEAEAALLTEYRGLRVADIAEVRNALRAANAEYKVLKNTLARIAVREVGYGDLADSLTGPTAIVFAKGDIVEAAKALDDAVKKFPVLVVKGGALKGGKVISAEDAKALARMESREVLLTKIAMLFNQPAQQTVNVFAALLRDLGSMLAQVVEKKTSGELPGGMGEPAAVGEAVADAAETEATTPEEVGVPTPEGDTAEEKAESAEETEVPEATDEDDDDSEDSSSSESEEEEGKEE